VAPKAPQHAATSLPGLAPTTRYALAALEAEAAEVAHAAEGGRNARLNRAAFSLGQLVAAGGLLRAGVESVLEAAAEACRLLDDEGIESVRRSIRSGLD